MIYLLMIYDFLSRALILWPFMIINSVSPLRFVFFQTRLVRVLLFVFLFSPQPVLMYAFHWRSVGISTCLLSCFIAVMQMRVCKDRMALGLYL